MTVFLSEIRFENAENFAEIVATDGEDLSGYSIAVYDGSGNFDSSFSLLGEYVTTIAGSDVYLVDRSDGLPDLGQTWGVALIDNSGSVVQFVSGEGNVITANDGPAAGETSLAGPATSGGESIETLDSGATYVANSTPSPGVIVCFASGTLIETPDGERAVEDLCPGEHVLTIDHGVQPIVWVHKSQSWIDEEKSDRNPILISASALGPGRPERDLVVSPQHRILVGGHWQLEGIFSEEVLVPAKSLRGLPGVRDLLGPNAVTWVHFAFLSHELVMSNGAVAESLLLGPMVRAGLDRVEKRALREKFSPRSGQRYWNGPPARTCLDVSTARAMIDTWSRGQGRLRCGEPGGCSGPTAIRGGQPSIAASCFPNLV